MMLHLTTALLHFVSAELIRRLPSQAHRRNFYGFSGWTGINSSTGTIDLSASTPGSYTVSYTTSGDCANTSNQPITISALDDASFNYSAAAFCVSGTDPTPAITGTTGRNFYASPAGLSITAPPALSTFRQVRLVPIRLLTLLPEIAPILLISRSLSAHLTMLHLTTALLPFVSAELIRLLLSLAQQGNFHSFSGGVEHRQLHRRYRPFGKYAWFLHGYLHYFRRLRQFF
jgi:hypothetical protein